MAAFWVVVIVIVCTVIVLGDVYCFLQADVCTRDRCMYRDRNGTMDVTAPVNVSMSRLVTTNAVLGMYLLLSLSMEGSYGH